MWALMSVVGLALAAPPQSQVVEHQSLNVQPKSVVVDALMARVDLRGLTAVEVRAIAKKSTLCPRTELVGGRTVLSCTSRRLKAAVAGGLLVLRTTQGPADNLAPLVNYTKEPQHGLGGPCPGTTPSARGECAFVEGRVIEAALELKKVWDTNPEMASHAAFRLGDIAWLGGDVEAAARWYDRTSAGAFGRLSATRLCELLNCLDGPSERLPFDVFDFGGLPPLVREEVILRRARALASSSRLDDAVRVLLPEASSVCPLQPVLCRKIAAAALMERVNRDAPEALALALQLPAAFEGEGAVDLAAAVADHTERMGAPLFAANVLAATSSQVAPLALDAWLLRCAERYLDARDAARAQAVFTFAKSRGFASGIRRTAWAKVQTRLTGSATRSPAHDDKGAHGGKGLAEDQGVKTPKTEQNEKNGTNEQAQEQALLQLKEKKS